MSALPLKLMRLKFYEIIERQMFEAVLLGIVFGSSAPPFEPPEFSVSRCNRR